MSVPPSCALFFHGIMQQFATVSLRHCANVDMEGGEQSVDAAFIVIASSSGVLPPLPTNECGDQDVFIIIIVFLFKHGNAATMDTAMKICSTTGVSVRPINGIAALALLGSNLKGHIDAEQVLPLTVPLWPLHISQYGHIELKIARSIQLKRSCHTGSELSSSQRTVHAIVTIITVACVRRIGQETAADVVICTAMCRRLASLLMPEFEQVEHVTRLFNHSSATSLSLVKVQPKL